MHCLPVPALAAVKLNELGVQGLTCTSQIARTSQALRSDRPRRLNRMALAFNLYALVATVPALAGSSASEQTLGPKTTAVLIHSAQPRLQNHQAWADDIVKVLDEHRLPANKENVCAVIAVISQESGFVENPTVPRLGTLAAKELAGKLKSIPLAGAASLELLEELPSPNKSFMDSIRRAKTEKDLDVTYRSIMDYPFTVSGGEILLETPFLKTIIKDVIESGNKIKTIGSMQVSVDFAIRHEEQKRRTSLDLPEIYKLRDWMYTRKGGLYYGVLQLLGYATDYTLKIHRFADYNAGRYASRNAAYQWVVAKLSGKKLDLDGDLLLYAENGEADGQPSSTEVTVRELANRYALNLTPPGIRQDLLQEKTRALAQTETYRALYAKYVQVKRQQPPHALIPEIVLHSPKIRHKMTTRDFAERVYGRYQNCMAKGL